MSGLCYADSVVIMSLKTVKYFSTIIVAAIAVFAGWWMWNYYMQSPWTRDGKVRAEQVSITPQVSGSISELYIKDNQFVNKGDVLFIIDKTPFHIAELNAQPFFLGRLGLSRFGFGFGSLAAVEAGQYSPGE